VVSGANIGRRTRWSESQFFLAALLLPLLLYDLVLQSSRLSLRLQDLVEPGRVGWAAGLALSAWWLACDVGFALFACVLLLVRDQGSKIWYAVAITLQIFAFLLGLVNTAATVYFLQTLDALDYDLLRHMLLQPRDLGLVMAGEVTVAQGALLGLLLLLEIIAPWVARAWARRSAVPPYPGRERRSRRWADTAAILSLPITAIGLLPPPVPVKDLALVRSPVLNVMITSYRAGAEIDPNVDQAVAEARFFEPGNLAISRSSAEPLRNLVFIVLESTRARSITPYQPSLQTTPFLDSLAARSLLVEKAYAVMPSTAKALTAIFCSIIPSPSVEPRALTPDFLGGCLPGLLRDQGYQTVYLQTANARFENRIAAVRNMGFETFIRPEDMPTAGFESPNFLGLEDDSMLEPSANWLRAHQDKPFFAAYLTVNPHHDYNRLTRNGVFHFAPSDDVLDRYLNNVRAEDAFLAQLFAQYEKLGLFANTLFVVVGDHGEAFGEHGRRAHNTVPYEEGVRVPLLLFDPGGKLFEPGHLPGPISQLDIVPTVLPLLGFRLTHGRMHGVSMFDSPRDRVLMISCTGSCAARVTDTEAYVHHFGRRPDELYDLRTDPEERQDIAPQYPQLAARRYQELSVFQRRIGAFFFLHTLHARQAPP
jgi:arylsulfatase A-like enzyme